MTKSKGRSSKDLHPAKHNKRRFGQIFFMFTADTLGIDKGRKPHQRRDRGADVVVNYRDLKGELAKHGLTFVDYIFILNDTDGHWDAVSELIAPQGHICSIVENERPLNQDKLKSKSAALHWEFMYTRSMYQTADMARQGEILNEVAKLVDNGVVESSLSETLHGLSVESITEAHRKVLEGHMRGKVVVEF